jgi:acetolactate synthase-1/2/3 large subunit
LSINQQQQEIVNGSRQTGGEAIVTGLLEHSIDTVFGLPGAQLYGLFDAFERSPLRVIGARHEQGCGYMAFGYARSTGRPSVYTVVPGPGILNAGAAALTSLGCNQQVLCLTGEVPSAFLGKGSGHLHEMPSQLATLRTFFKHADRISHPSSAAASVALAFQQMRAGRPGPAALEMPWDVFTQTAATEPALKLPVLSSPVVDLDRIDDLLALIAKSRAPMIFVGTGALHASEEIRELAERIQAPVVAFRGGRGIVGNDHPLGVDLVSAYRLWGQTDLAIGIGTRMEVPRWRWGWKPEGLKWARIDIDPAEMHRFTHDVDLVADSRDAVRALLQALDARGVSNSHRSSVIAHAREAAAPEIASVRPQIDYLNVLREVLPADGFVTDELSQVGFTSLFGFPVYQPRTFISSGFQGNLGSGFQTALGVKVAHPDKPVVAICGDGGFLFGVQELATAVQYGIGVVTLVFNNNAYGNVRRDQLLGFEGRVVGADLVNPDFVKLAESFGVGACRVDSPQAFRKALELALADGGPRLIEISVVTDSETNPWPLLMPTSPPKGL